MSVRPTTYQYRHDFAPPESLSNDTLLATVTHVTGLGKPHWTIKFPDQITKDLPGGTLFSGSPVTLNGVEFADDAVSVLGKVGRHLVEFLTAKRRADREIYAAVLAFVKGVN